MYQLKLVTIFTIIFFVSKCWSKDETSTYHMTDDYRLVYYQGSGTKTLNYTDSIKFCNLMGGNLPTSFNNIYPLYLSTQNRDGDLFWIGAYKDVNETNYIWPDGRIFEFNEGILSAKECQDGRCCAVTAKWHNGKLDYAPRSCYLIFRPVCVLNNSPLALSNQIEQIKSTHQKIKSELVNLKQDDEQEDDSGEQVADEPDADLVNPDSFISDKETGRVYYHDKSMGTYDDSVDFCKKIGGVLTSVTSVKEAQFLAKIAGKYRRVWVGSSKSVSSLYTYHWLDGSIFDWNLWRNPANKSDEHALTLASYADKLGELFEVKCSYVNRRICLMNPKITTPITPTFKPSTEKPITKPVTQPERTTPAPPPPIRTTTTTTTAVSTRPPTTIDPIEDAKGVDAKLKVIVARLNRQEKLLNDLITVLQKAYS